MNHQDILYQQAIENEKKMRLNADKKQDFKLADQLRKDLYVLLGIESNYLCDLYYRKITDDKCISILIKYIPLFQNVGISLNLITQQFWRKKNTECSDF